MPAAPSGSSVSHSSSTASAAERYKAHPPRYMPAAPLTPHRYLSAPSRRSPTRSPHPPPAHRGPSVPASTLVPCPKSQQLWPSTEPLEPLGDPPVAAAPAPEASSRPHADCRAKLALERVFFFFFFASVTFLWLLGTRSTYVQVKWEVGFYFYFDPSSIDGWMRFWF